MLADSVENLYDLDIKRFKSRVFEDFIKDSTKINNSEYRKSNLKISLYRVEDRIRAAKN